MEIFVHFRGGEVDFTLKCIYFLSKLFNTFVCLARCETNLEGLDA